MEEQINHLTFMIRVQKVVICIAKCELVSDRGDLALSVKVSP